MDIPKIKDKHRLEILTFSNGPKIQSNERILRGKLHDLALKMNTNWLLL